MSYSKSKVPYYAFHKGFLVMVVFLVEEIWFPGQIRFLWYFWVWPGCQDAKTKVTGAGELWGERTQPLETLTVPCGWLVLSLLCWHLCTDCGPVMWGHQFSSPRCPLGRTLSSWVPGQWLHTPSHCSTTGSPSSGQKSQPPHQTLISVILAHCSFSPLYLMLLSSWSLSCCCYYCCCFGFPAPKSPGLGLALELQPIAHLGGGYPPWQYPAISLPFLRVASLLPQLL